MRGVAVLNGGGGNRGVGERVDRSDQGSEYTVKDQSDQVYDPVETVRNQFACCGDDVLGGVVDEPKPDCYGVLVLCSTPGAVHPQPAPDGRPTTATPTPSEVRLRCLRQLGEPRAHHSEPRGDANLLYVCDACRHGYRCLA